MENSRIIEENYLVYTYSSFRGLAGEVIVGFLRPGIFLTLIPVLGYWLIVGVVLYLLSGRVSPPFLMLLLLVSAAPLVGRFAVASANGDLHCGFFSTKVDRGEVYAYTIRYIALTCVWVTLVAAIVYLFLDGGNSVLAMFGPMGFAKFGFKTLLIVLVAVICLLAPTLCLLLATVTQSVGQAFSPDPWRWLYHFRRADLLVFYSSLFGGIIVFYCVWAIPLAIIATLAFTYSPAMGAAVVGYVYLFPALASAVLIGRMCGAFAIGDEEIDRDEAEKQFNEAILSDPTAARASALAVVQAADSGSVPSTAPASASAPISVAPSKAFPVAEVLKKVKSISADNIREAIQGAELRQNKNPNDLEAGVELVLLYRKADLPDKAKEKAAAAIVTAVEQHTEAAAALAFRSLQKDRHTLELEVPVLFKLGSFLLGEKLYADAGWCLHEALAKQGSDANTSQKKLIEIAEQASSAGKSQDALAIYDIFLKKYPDSTFTDYVRKAAENEKRKSEQKA